MPIARLICVTVAPERMADAERVWKHECAPLMIQQPGCLSEELLKCLDAPGEYISYAEWEDQAAIDRYLASPAHDEIRRPAPSLQREGRPVVKRYEVAGPERSSAADRGPRQPARDARDVLAVVGAASCPRRRGFRAIGADGISRITRSEDQPVRGAGTWVRMCGTPRSSRRRPKAVSTLVMIPTKGVPLSVMTSSGSPQSSMQRSSVSSIPATALSVRSGAKNSSCGRRAPST